MNSAAVPDLLLPVRAPRIFEAICSQVREQMAIGVLRPGDKLPAERELAEQLGSSRTAVREALRSLEMAGIVELRKGVKGGAFICEGDPEVVTRSLGDMVSLGRISLESLTESRVIIQDAVVRLACERGTSADFDAMERSIERTRELTEKRQWDERRIQLVNFYKLLARATRNEVMAILVDALTQIVLSIVARDDTIPRSETVTIHLEIVRCLRRGDADRAVDLMSRHLKALNEHLLESSRRRALRSKPATTPKPSTRGSGKAPAKTGLKPAQRRRVAPA